MSRARKHAEELLRFAIMLERGETLIGNMKGFHADLSKCKGECCS